jgi:hypothetical protein
MHAPPERYLSTLCKLSCVQPPPLQEAGPAIAATLLTMSAIGVRKRQNTYITPGETSLTVYFVLCKPVPSPEGGMGGR